MVGLRSFCAQTLIAHKWRQENVAGLIGLAGDLLLLLAGDLSSLIATCCSLAAEATLISRGHRAWGLALGWFLFAASNTVLAMVMARQHGALLALPLAFGAAVFTIGALRLPLGILAARLRCSTPCVARPAAQICTLLKPLCGLVGAIGQLPIIVGALACGSHALAAASACWIAQDLLAGRALRLARALLKRATMMQARLAPA